MNKKDAETVMSIVKGFPPIKGRVPTFQRPDAIKSAERRERGEASYDWLINDWIPSQPDSAEIMKLTILLGFNLGLVVAALIGQDVFERELMKAAAERED